MSNLHYTSFLEMPQTLLWDLGGGVNRPERENVRREKRKGKARAEEDWKINKGSKGGWETTGEKADKGG